MKSTPTPHAIPDVSIVFTNWNTRDLMRDCIHSVREHSSGFVYEIVVVDDGSTDGSVDMLTKEFPETRIVRNERNLGVARSYNRGFAAATGRYVQMLNTDMLFIHNAIRIMYDFLESHPEAAACAGKLRNADMSVQVSYGRFPSLFEALVGALFLPEMFPNAGLPQRGILPRDDDRGPIESEYLCGADMLIRKSVIDTVGPFDELYTSYCEETDFCYRVLRETGMKLYYIPQAEIIHFGGASFKSVRAFQLQLMYSSYDKFLKKHHGAAYSLVTRWMYAFRFAVKAIVRLMIFLIRPESDRWRYFVEALLHARFAIFPREPVRKA
jgi:GT2 family glycosyltransferase